MDQHQDILTKDEEFHLQRAKKNWARLGDRNTSYFHQSIVKRYRKNTIAYLQNPDGTDSTTANQIASTLLHYFQDIFATNQTNNTSQQLSTLQVPSPSNLQHATVQYISSTPTQQQAQMQQQAEFHEDQHTTTSTASHQSHSGSLYHFTNSTPDW